MGRARIGGAPGRIIRHVLAVLVLLTAVLVLHVGAVPAGNLAAGWWPDGPPLSPRVVVTTVFIGRHGLVGAWFLEPAVPAVLRVHSWTVDRAAGSARSGR